VSPKERRMATCPACGIEVGPESKDCPRCHLAVTLFDSIREAAGPSAGADPTYLRTIGELLATVDLAAPAVPAAGPDPVQGLLSRPDRSVNAPEVAAAAPAPPRPAPPLVRVLDFPPEPPSPTELTELRHRVEEYFQLGRRLGLDFTDFEERAHSAALVDDVDSLEILAREMYVHLSSSIAEEYESVLARRNELAQQMATAGADVEITAVRRAIGVGDLAGAQRRISHVRDLLTRSEEEWQVGRILVTEGELMSVTIRELGGNPSSAAGPLEEGRRLFVDGHRPEAERVLAKAAVGLWTLLQPLLLADLRRLRDRMLEARSAGLDIEPGVRELRAVSTELRKRNFVGTIVSYRRLKSAVERAAPAGVEVGAPGALSPEMRSSPSA
jgi:hypothetical protein